MINDPGYAGFCYGDSPVFRVRDMWCVVSQDSEGLSDKMSLVAFLIDSVAPTRLNSLVAFLPRLTPGLLT